jgi:hypothetical protein
VRAGFVNDRGKVGGRICRAALGADGKSEVARCTAEARVPVTARLGILENFGSRPKASGVSGRQSPAPQISVEKMNGQTEFKN